MGVVLMCRCGPPAGSCDGESTLARTTRSRRRRSLVDADQRRSRAVLRALPRPKLFTFSKEERPGRARSARNAARRRDPRDPGPIAFWSTVYHALVDILLEGCNGVAHGPSIRFAGPPPGHARPARPPRALVRRAPWARHRHRHPDAIGRHAARRPRLALSGAATARAARVDQGLVGRLRQQSAGALLLAH